MGVKYVIVFWVCSKPHIVTMVKLNVRMAMARRLKPLKSPNLWHDYLTRLALPYRTTIVRSCFKRNARVRRTWRHGIVLMSVELKNGRNVCFVVLWELLDLAGQNEIWRLRPLCATVRHLTNGWCAFGFGMTCSCVTFGCVLFLDPDEGNYHQGGHFLVI